MSEWQRQYAGGEVALIPHVDIGLEGTYWECSGLRAGLWGSGA